MMLNENNHIYTAQLVSLMLIASLTYKVVMLPKYMSIIARESAFVSVAIMMAIEVVMYCLVYYVITRVNVQREENKALMIPLMIAMYGLCMLRLTVFVSETITYISSTLFDDGRIIFILLALIPALAYLVYKGGNIIGRLSQIIFWLIVFSVGLSILFMRVNADIRYLTPMFSEGFDSVLESCNKYYLWFGDYIPFLFLFVQMNKQDTRKKAVFPITLVIIFVGVILFYVLFTSIYGGATHLIDFAFSKIGIYTKISQLLGTTDFPAVITWLLMAIIKLALLLYASAMALTYFIKRKGLALLINSVIVGGLVGFVVMTVEQSFEIATSWIRYVAAVIQYSAPIILAIFVRVKYGKTSKA